MWTRWKVDDLASLVAGTLEGVPSRHANRQP